MSRIYYKEEKLNGQPIATEYINIELFNFIFENTYTNEFELQGSTNSSFFGLLKSKKEVFKNVRLSKDNIHYKASEGDFYLPNAIIFYDLDDYAFPSEYYFIAKIGNEIELKKCNAGKDIKWFQTPELYKPVNDQKVIAKIENSLTEIKKLVKTTNNKKIDIEREKIELEEKRKIESNRPLLASEQKKAYEELTEFCVNNNSNKVKIIEFIDTLKDYDVDSEFYTTLNYFMDYLEEKEFNFIMRLDWKAEIEDLEWLLERVLKDNHNLTINLPKPESYDKNASVSSHNVFEDFDQALRKNGLQLGFIDTQSDEYIIVLHKILDKGKIESIVNKIGYEYDEK